MLRLPVISLNSGWKCAYIERESLSQASVEGRNVTLADWTFDTERSANLTAEFERTFVLHPTGFCVRYFLTMESAPQDTAIYFNGQHVGAYTDTPFKQDVTEYVALDANTITLRVAPESSGQFAGVRLQAVPCDE